ncbi:MFS general substrate transporter [Corynespora cassiicola Philippines]|uniref:MFS general substrate transporter n=1 Tax=Corynespora cassiicola Philippines TaxID=1448308 RepID=A0A2T2N938_CORCC|nr:MFS general substrate transporter [Corynespora cassiicola Philippines]
MLWNRPGGPVGLRWRSSSFFICCTVGMGAFTDLFLYELIVPVLPFVLKDRVNVPDDAIQSTISYLLAAYAAASFLTSPIAGVLADKLTSSRQLPFLLGLVLLLLSTILLAVGRTVPVLVLARCLQGASGGVVWTIGLALLIETVGHESLGKTIGTIFSFVSVANLFAPTVGGLLYAKTGYNGVIGIGLALVVIDFVLRLFVIEKKVAVKYAAENSDSGSSATDSGYATESTPLLSETSPNLSRFRLREPKWRVPKNFPILLMLKDPGLLTAFFISFMQALLLGAFDATVPLVASSCYGFDSLKAGLLFLPLACADFLLGPVFGWVVDRWGTRPVAIAGFMWLVPSLTLLRLPTESVVTRNLDQIHEIALYASILAVNGVGLAIINSPAIVEAGNIVGNYYQANSKMFSQAPYAQLYGINSMVFSAGLTVGPLLSGTLRERIGYGNMNAVLAGICGFAAILAALFVGRKVHDENLIESDDE